MALSVARLKALDGYSDVTLGTKVDAMRLKAQIFEHVTMEQAEAALVEWLTAPIAALLTKELPANKTYKKFRLHSNARKI